MGSVAILMKARFRCSRVAAAEICLSKRCVFSETQGAIEKQDQRS